MAQSFLTCGYLIGLLSLPTAIAWGASTVQLAPDLPVSLATRLHEIPSQTSGGTQRFDSTVESTMEPTVEPTVDQTITQNMAQLGDRVLGRDRPASQSGDR